MERWLKSVAAEAAPVDEQKAVDRVTAIKAEMAKAWDDVPTRDAMLKHVEAWLAYGGAPEGVKGCMLREDLYPLLVEVYQEKHPQDFEAKPALGVEVAVEANGEGAYREVEPE
jgi:hypothetical protein